MLRFVPIIGKLLLSSVWALPLLVADAHAYDPRRQPAKPSIEIHLEVLETLRNDRLPSHYMPERNYPGYQRRVPQSQQAQRQLRQKQQQAEPQVQPQPVAREDLPQMAPPPPPAPVLPAPAVAEPGRTTSAASRPKAIAPEPYKAPPPAEVRKPQVVPREKSAPPSSPPLTPPAPPPPPPPPPAPTPVSQPEAAKESPLTVEPPVYVPPPPQTDMMQAPPPPLELPEVEEEPVSKSEAEDEAGEISPLPLAPALDDAAVNVTAGQEREAEKITSTETKRAGSEETPADSVAEPVEPVLPADFSAGLFGQDEDGDSGEAEEVKPEAEPSGNEDSPSSPLPEDIFGDMMNDEDAGMEIEIPDIPELDGEERREEKESLPEMPDITPDEQPEETENKEEETNAENITETEGVNILPPVEVKEAQEEAASEDSDDDSMFSGISGMISDFLSNDDAGDDAENKKVVIPAEPEPQLMPEVPELPQMELAPPPPLPEPELPEAELPEPEARVIPPLPEKPEFAKGEQSEKQQIAGEPKGKEDEGVNETGNDLTESDKLARLVKLLEAEETPGVKRKENTEPVKVADSTESSNPSADADDPLLELAGFLDDKFSNDENAGEGAGDGIVLDELIEPAAGNIAAAEGLAPLTALTGEPEAIVREKDIITSLTKEVKSKPLAPPPLPLPDTSSTVAAETEDKQGNAGREKTEKKEPAAEKSGSGEEGKNKKLVQTQIKNRGGDDKEDSPPQMQEVASLLATDKNLKSPDKKAEASPVKTDAKLSQSVDLRIIFAEDDTDIPDDVKAQLNELAEKLVRGNMRVNIEAYARGNEEQSTMARRVSLSRALAIRAYLIDKGVDSLRINVKALGNKEMGSSSPDRADLSLL